MEVRAAVSGQLRCAAVDCARKCQMKRCPGAIVPAPQHGWGWDSEPREWCHTGFDRPCAAITLASGNGPQSTERESRVTNLIEASLMPKCSKTASRHTPSIPYRDHLPEEVGWSQLLELTYFQPSQREESKIKKEHAHQVMSEHCACNVLLHGHGWVQQGSFCTQTAKGVCRQPG